MRTESFVLERCTTIPRPLLPGVLYYSEKYALTIHLCACGCGEQAVLPVREPEDEHNWKFDAAGPTFSPSILNRGCQAHYYIEAGRVRWA